MMPPSPAPTMSTLGAVLCGEVDADMLLIECTADEIKRKTTKSERFFGQGNVVRKKEGKSNWTAAC